MVRLPHKTAGASTLNVLILSVFPTLQTFRMNLRDSLVLLLVATTQAQSTVRRGLQSSQVTALQLINTKNGAVIKTLASNDVIDISSIGSSLSIQALVSGPVGSVRFGYGNQANFQTESLPPYAMCSDWNGSFTSCPVLSAGRHTVKATPYSLSEGKGFVGTSKTVTFTLVRGSAPVPAPARVPAPAPVPVRSPPTGPSSCKVPKLVADWLSTTVYPISAAEAQGLIIGDDFIIFSGFSQQYSQATAKNYALNLRSPNAKWRAMDDLPVSKGITHGAYARVGMKLFLCGGYLGGHPGPHINTCLVYDHSVAPGSGKQWKFFPSLPEGRAGGALVYDSYRKALIFAGGAERPKAGDAHAEDYQHTWMYEFSNPGWKEMPDIPFLSNHMSYVTTKDAAGKSRHYFVGGQVGENEYTGNNNENYEFDAIEEKWIKRKDMPFTRGHASSSTTAVPCGYIIAGGSTNEYGKTKDISFYDIDSDRWTKIGELPDALNTPVCAIDYAAGMYYCETGWVDGKFSTKRKIEL